MPFPIVKVAAMGTSQALCNTGKTLIPQISCATTVITLNITIKNLTYVFLVRILCQIVSPAITLLSAIGACQVTPSHKKASVYSALSSFATTATSMV